MISLLFENSVLFFLLVGALIISISVHEFSHAYAAFKLGDPTGKNMGRLTLNPKAHLDPIGTIFLLFVGFGWGKPVPFNPFNLKNPKRDSAIISFAGPMSNMLLAIIVALIIRIFNIDSTNLLLAKSLYLVVFYNLLLCFFNLIPLGPLDGNKIVFGILPNRLAIQWAEMQRYGTYILLFLIVFNYTGKIISPLVVMTIKILGLNLLFLVQILGSAL